MKLQEIFALKARAVRGLCSLILTLVVWSNADAASLQPYCGSDKSSDGYSGLAAQLSQVESAKKGGPEVSASTPPELHQGTVVLSRTAGIDLNFRHWLSDSAIEVDDPAKDSIFSITVFRDDHAIGTLRFADETFSLPDLRSMHEGRIGVSSRRHSIACSSGKFMVAARVTLSTLAAFR